MKTPVPFIPAMEFYHGDGLVPAWKHAQRFADKGGRVATMEDIVSARLAAPLHTYPWQRYFTTASAEYLGYSKSGKRLLIIAHGVGPMATLDGATEAYRFEFGDKNRNRNGGRIPMTLFHKLESGHYGEVSIVDFDAVVSRYRYPFHEILTYEQLINEPLIAARFGARSREYLDHYHTMVRAWHLKEDEKTIDDPYLIRMEGPGDRSGYVVGGFNEYPLEYRALDAGDGAIAHLLSIGGLAHTSHQSKYRVSSMLHDVSCHAWWHGTRMVGVKGAESVKEIHHGFGDIGELILHNWPTLMQGVEDRIELPSISALVAHESVFFTQYPKHGAVLDTYEPEFLVTKAEKVGVPFEFTTPSYGSPFLKYDVREVAAHMPKNANAYRFVSEPVTKKVTDKSVFSVKTQFYRIKADTSQRLIRRKSLEHNYDLLMSLLAPEVAE